MEAETMQSYTTKRGLTLSVGDIVTVYGFTATVTQIRKDQYRQKWVADLLYFDDRASLHSYREGSPRARFDWMDCKWYSNERGDNRFRPFTPTED